MGRCELEDNILDVAHLRAFHREDALIVDAHGGEVAEAEREHHRAAGQQLDALHERIVARASVVAHVVHHAAAIRAPCPPPMPFLPKRLNLTTSTNSGRVAGPFVEHHLLCGGEIGVHGHEAVRGDGDP